MTYNWLKFIHVVAVILWIGGMVMLLLLNRAFARVNDQAAARAVGQQGGALSMKLFLPAFLVTFVTGIGMVQVGDLSFGAPWISWGMTGALLSMIIGGLFTGRNARKLGQQIARGEIDPPAIAAAQRKILIFAVLNLLLLLSIVWVMVFKP